MSHVIIETERARLRPTTPEDLDVLRAFFAEAEVNEHWGGQPLTDDEIGAKYLGKRSPAVECFMVEVDSEPFGLVQYWTYDGGEGGGIDLVLAPAARGQGLGRIVVGALVAYLRGCLGWNRITVDPDVANPRGVAFWKAAGFAPQRLVEDEPQRGPYWLMAWPTEATPS